MAASAVSKEKSSGNDNDDIEMSVISADGDQMVSIDNDKSAEELKRMGILTAISVMLHNLPEGLASTCICTS